MSYQSSKLAILIVSVLMVVNTAEGQSFEWLYHKLDSAYEQSDFETCLDIEQQVINSIGARQDTLVANTFYYLGDSYLDQYDFNNAIAYFSKELVLRGKLLPLDPDGYSNAAFNLMYTYSLSGDVSNAINTGKKLLSFDKSRYGIDSEEYIYSLGDFVDLLVESDQFNDAELQCTAAMSELSKESSYYSLIQARLGYIFVYKGLYSKANRCYEDAMPIIKKNFGESSQEYQITLANYGAMLIKQGKLDQAEQVLTSSLAKIRYSDWQNSDLLYYNALNNLALVYQSLGQFALSEKYYRTILSNDSLTIGVSHPDFAITLSNLGLLYTDEGKHEDAEKVLLRSLAILKENGEEGSLSYGRKLNNLAKNYQQAGKIEEAIEMLQEALQIFQNQLGKMSPEYATALHNLGSAYLISNPMQAFPYLKQALSIRNRMLGGNHPLHAQTQQQLAKYQWVKKDQKQAATLFESVFKNYFLQIENFFPILTEEEKANLFFGAIRPSQELYTNWLSSEAKNDPKEVGNLYTITLNTKGLIMYATEKVKSQILKSSDTTLIYLYDQWESQKELISYYYSQNQDPKMVEALVASSKVTEKELSRLSSSFSRGFIRPRITWRQVKEKLKVGEAAVEIIRYRKFDIDSMMFNQKSQYAALILTAASDEGPTFVELPDGDLLEGRYLNYYQNGLQFKIDDEYSYDFFWRIIHEKLKSNNVSRVYLSTDGVYNQISLGSIWDPLTKKYLIEELDIHQLASTRDLAIEGNSRKKNHTGLLIGFPKYSLGDQVDISAKSEIMPNIIVNRSIRGSLSKFVSEDRELPELPGTKVEINSISGTLSSKYTTTVLMEKDATEKRLKQSSSPEILHIATHGYFLQGYDNLSSKNQNPLLNSGLILAGASDFILTGHNPLHDDEDGVLTAYEAMNLDLSETSLVVLSACETGLGAVESGEGVYGLQRAFQLAGAQHIIMSLWSVDDIATQKLMSKFYEEWLASGDVYESFRKAQLNNKDLFKNPYYWGAFVLVGSP